MKLKAAWLVTWEVIGRPHKPVDNEIAAILPARFSERTIKFVLKLLYSQYLASPTNLFDLASFAKRVPYSNQPGIWCCGNSVFLRARRVANLELQNDDFNTGDYLCWDEADFQGNIWRKSYVGKTRQSRRRKKRRP